MMTGARICKLPVEKVRIWHCFRLRVEGFGSCVTEIVCSTADEREQKSSGILKPVRQHGNFGNRERPTYGGFPVRVRYRMWGTRRWAASVVTLV